MPLAIVDQTRVSADEVGKLAQCRMAIKQMGFKYEQHDSDLRWRGPYGIGDHMGALREELFLTASDENVGKCASQMMQRLEARQPPQLPDGVSETRRHTCGQTYG